MAVIPSFSGDGMAIALHTSALAVSAYHIRANKELSPQIRRAALLMKLISHPLCQKLLLVICYIMPCLLGFLAKKTRITSMSGRAFKELKV